MAHKGEGQDGDCVDSLENRAANSKCRLGCCAQFGFGKGKKVFALVDLYLRVEDKVFWCAGVLAVVNGGGVHMGQGGVQHLAKSFIQCFVLRQWAGNLELLDNHLEYKTTDD